MNTPLPPVSLYEQFYVVGIIVLVLIVIGLIARMLVKDLVEWQSGQDEKRDAERQAQRDWMDVQELKREADRKAREESWQTFFKTINGDNQAAIYRLVEINTKLVERIEALTVSMSDHDNYVRNHLDTDEAARPSHPPVRRSK